MISPDPGVPWSGARQPAETGGLRLREQLPDPARLWIRWTPVRWPAPAQRWTDGARNLLIEAASGAAGEDVELSAGLRDDVIGLPPAAAGRRREFDELIERLAAAGTPVIAQRLPGEARGAESLCLVDLTEQLLAAGEAPAIERAPEGAWALWPLIPGRTDGDARVMPGLDRLVAAGMTGVHAVVPELSPRQRRDLAEGAGEEVFSALFHGGPVDERRFHQQAAARGLLVFVPRPLPGAPGRAGNRRLAELLFRLGDLGRRLCHPVGRSETLWSAARQVDRCEHDLERLARESNLGIVTWLEPAVRDILEGFLRDGRSPQLEELQREYLTGEAR